METNQGTYTGDGTTYPVPTWDGPEGYVFLIHDIGDGGFVLAPDGSFILETRP